jgi:DNA-binding MarR family transcriptional regulator
MLRLTSDIQSELKRRLRDTHSTTLPKFDVLSALSRHPAGLKMSELSDYLRLSNGNLTGLIDRLTKDGFVLRVAVPGDRRAQMVRLTQAGQDFFRNVAQDHEVWINELLSAFSAEDADHLVDQIKNRGIGKTETH